MRSPLTPLVRADARRLRWLLLVPVVLVFMACGAASTVASLPTPTPTATATTPPTPNATLDLVSASKSFSDSVNDGGTTAPCANGDPLISGNCGLTVTATCPNGEWAVSGGFSATGAGAYSTSSYPSSSGSWTVTIHDEGNGNAGTSVTVTAIANCLKANFATTTQIITSGTSVAPDSTFYPVSAGCPTGSVLTGGGYRGSNGVQGSKPSGNAWLAQLSVQTGSSASPATYAVCASAHVQTGTAASSTKALAPSDTPTLSAACPTGTTLIGGGFDTTGPTGLGASQAASDLSGWQVQVSGASGATGPGATASVTVYSLCTTFA